MWEQLPEIYWAGLVVVLGQLGTISKRNIVQVEGRDEEGSRYLINPGAPDHLSQYQNFKIT